MFAKQVNVLLPCLNLFKFRCACVGLLLARLQCCEAGSAHFIGLSDTDVIALLGAAIFCKCPKHHVHCCVSLFRELILYFDFGMTRILRCWKTQPVTCGPDVKTSHDPMLLKCHCIVLFWFTLILKQVTVIVICRESTLLLITCRRSD